MYICSSDRTKTLEKSYFEKLLIYLEKGFKINQKEFIKKLIKLSDIKVLQ